MSAVPHGEKDDAWLTNSRRAPDLLFPAGLRGSWVASPSKVEGVTISGGVSEDDRLEQRVLGALAPYLLGSAQTVETSSVRRAGLVRVGLRDREQPSGDVLTVELSIAQGTVKRIELSAARQGWGLDPCIAQSMVEMLATALAHGEPNDAGSAAVLREASTGAVNSVPAADLVDAIRARAEQAPEAVAIDSIAGTTSFAELVSAADGYAAILDGSGFPGIVAITYARDVASVVAMLGTLQSGRAYLLLSEDDPASYRSEILDQLGAVEGPTPVVEGEGLTAPSRRELPGTALAYVAFTSGTTGRPKAVAVSRAQLSSYCAFLEQVNLCGPARLLPALSGPSFDAILKQIWGQLHAGGTVYFPRDRDVLRSVQLALESSPATINVVPSLWREILDLAHIPDVEGVLLLGGEELSPALVDATAAAYPGLRLVNLYGPAECTSNSTWHPIGQIERDTVPIGSAIKGARTDVLGRDLQPVPFGAVGELHVGGEVVAHGYLGDARRTAEAFVPSPAPGDTGGRMYATGDLVRMTSDGLVFLGRADREAKINGVRADLTQLAIDLEQGVPSVQRAVVDSTSGLLRAYIISAGPNAVAEVEKYVRSTWRGEFQATVVTAVPEIPRLASGKVDVTALRASAHADSVTEASPLPPEQVGERAFTESDEIDTITRALWGHALRQPVDASGPVAFRDVGGDSLKFLKLIALYRRILGIDVTADDFIGHETVDSHREILRGELSASQIADAMVSLGVRNDEH